MVSVIMRRCKKRKEVFMKRKKVSKKVSQKMFTRSADRTHKVNFAPVPMRGGFSL